MYVCIYEAVMGYETRLKLNGCTIRNGCGNGDGDSPRMNGSCGLKVVTVTTPPSPSPSSSSSFSGSPSPRRFIEHYVTKMDTLAGVAIRYGVEVADIKKMNNLVTDRQMFALKTLRIPLPGRHPPSPCLSNGHSSAGSGSFNQSPSRHMHSDLLESFPSLKLTPDRKLSPAMSSLRDFYGLNNGGMNSSEGYELSVYSKGSPIYQEDEGFSTSSSLMNPPLSQHRRSTSVANDLKEKEDELTNDVSTYYHQFIYKLRIRPQKTEKILKDESGIGGWFSAITEKGLALRTKAVSRTNLACDGESNGENGFSFNLEESVSADSSSEVRKSTSTASLPDQDSNGSVSIWSSWSLKPDLQAAFSNPIFDGFPKPITGRKGKAALD